LNHPQHTENSFRKTAVPALEGFELLPAGMVVYCEANDNYTHLFLKNKTKIIACRTLKEMEGQLQDFPSFVRVHHYVRGEGGYLVMIDGNTVNVSRSRKEALMKIFLNISPSQN